MKKLLFSGILCLTLCAVVSCTKTENSPAPATQKSQQQNALNEINRTELLNKLVGNQNFINSFKAYVKAMALPINRVNAMTASEKEAWQIARANLSKDATLEQIAAIYPFSATEYSMHFDAFGRSLELVNQDIPELGSLSASEYGAIMVDGYQMVANTDGEWENVPYWGNCIWNALMSGVEALRGGSGGEHLKRVEEFTFFLIMECF